MNNQRRRIPTLEEIHSENPDAWAQDQLKTLLNSPPPQKWIKTNKNISYVPVDKVEYLLDYIFGRWRLEVLEIKQVLNSIVATVRVHYFNPAVGETGEWDFHDGVGAMPIQFDAGQMGNPNAIKHNAIQLAAPAAVSYAKKDACDNIGKIFGRDVSRKDTLTWMGSFESDPYQGQQAQQAPPNGFIQPPPPPPVLQMQQPTLPIAPPTAQPQIQVDDTPPMFDANFFAPTPQQQQVAQQQTPLNNKIDF